MNVFDKLAIASIKKKYEDRPGDVYHTIHVKHEDGSECIMNFCHYERVELLQGNFTFTTLVVYPEHNTVSVFPECDLESVIVKPFKGRKFKIKLNKKLKNSNNGK